LCYLRVKTSCFVCDFSLGFIIFALHSVTVLHLPGFGVVLIKNIVMRKILLLTYLLLFSCVVALAQDIEGPIPTALVVDSKGELHDLSIGDEYQGEAPVTVRFYAKARDVNGYSLTCTWEFFKEGEETPYLVRHDADVQIELRDSGVVTVMPTITYTSIEDSEIYWPFGEEYYEAPFRIVLSESGLEAPNAFSPNGDGINDYYNVFNTKSIVEFHGAIYNRWGQLLYSWGIDEMAVEGRGWDGTFKGNPVKDGVYFVVIKAKGADGVEYDIKRDVNLLRGYTESVK
jgi:gliding motility-associated-like protein